MTTLIDLIKELRANGVTEYKGILNGEEVFLKLLAANPEQIEVPKQKLKSKREPVGGDGLTRDQQLSLYGQVHTEDFT